MILDYAGVNKVHKTGITKSTSLQTPYLYLSFWSAPASLVTYLFFSFSKNGDKHSFFFGFVMQRLLLDELIKD